MTGRKFSSPAGPPRRCPVLGLNARAEIDFRIPNSQSGRHMFLAYRVTFLTGLSVALAGIVVLAAGVWRLWSFGGGATPEDFALGSRLVIVGVAIMGCSGVLRLLS